MRNFASIFLLLFSSSLLAQELSSDSLFTLARQKAFKEDNYPAAKELCKKALAKSPDYTDIRVFLGRLYIYTDQNDSARTTLEEALKRNPKSLDALGSLYDLYYWNDQPGTAYDMTTKALAIDSLNEDFRMKQVKALNAMGDYESAKICLDTLLKINPKNTAARAYAQILQRRGIKNRVSASYDIDFFNKTYTPWQFADLSYTRNARIGTIIGRISAANRFNTTGYQLDGDWYPDISKKMYAYVNMGFSTTSLFPKYRLGFSLYRSLPKAYEADLGFRLLYFSDITTILTAALGKYYSNYWFSLRTFVTPGSTGVSQSYFLTARKYFSSANNFIGITLGTGASPDETKKDLYFISSPTSLQARKIRLAYQHELPRNFILGLRAGFERAEYIKGSTRDDLTFGVVLDKLF